MTLKQIKFTLAFFFVGPCFASASEPPLGTITRISGRVERTDLVDTKTNAAIGESIFKGTRLTTSSDGEVEVTLTSGSVMRIRPNSSLQLSPVRRRRSNKSSIVLFFGRLWSRVSSAVGQDGNYEINSPTAVAGVRGTEFETAVGQDGSVRVRVSEGRVDVASDNQMRKVARGERVDADIEGVSNPTPADRDPNWQRWSDEKRKHVKQSGVTVMRSMKESILERQDRTKTLRAQQERLMAEISRWERELRLGAPEAPGKLRALNEELTRVEEQIADLSDRSRSQFGYAAYLSELADDPRFAMIGAADIRREAKTLLQLKRQFDAFEKEGEDISIKGMDRMLEDIRGGKRESLRDKPGSVKDLFGD